MANVGGMQRVAVELYQALGTHPGIDLDAIVLRSSWRWHHIVGTGWANVAENDTCTFL